MDVIQRAMEKNLHISENENLNLQTWQTFTENAADKKVFLFGTGAGAEFFFKNYNTVKLDGIIDNDIKKQGFQADDFVGEAWGAEYGRLEISSMDLLKRYHPDKILILITSTNYYEQIIEELEGIGIENYFVLLMMEANKRIESGYMETDDAIYSPAEYAELCCQKEIEWNKLLFYSFGTYSDHGKYITKALLGIRKDLDIVWAVNDMTLEVPQGVRKVYLGNWKRYICEMETAKIWIYNMPVPQYMVKRHGQIYIQTKHWASVTLKKFYLDTKARADTQDNVVYWRQDSSKMDYIITGSNFDTESSRRGFDFHKEVIQVGSPRSDAMFHGEEMKRKVYSYYGLDLEKRMLLYAPTYRYDKNSPVGAKPKQVIREIDLDYGRVKTALERYFGGAWYIALRLHPGHEKEIEKLGLPEYVIDVSRYGDGEEVTSACDILISDYSSIMFEPAFVKKPVFLFATDKKEYIDKEYDLLIAYDTLPFPIAESNDELIKNIECFVQADYEKAVDCFMDQYGVHEDGHASERAAKYISELMSPLVSVIVPIYNTQEFLPRCLDSILDQTYIDMEIILVNDGSTDGSLSVCESYAVQDTRIQIIDQPNQGALAARREGVKLCRGAYVMFVDSDDWIEPELLEVMVGAAREYGCSLVCTNVSMESGSRIIERRNAIPSGVYETEKIAKDLFYYKDTDRYGILPYNVAKLYSRDILKEAIDDVSRDIRYAEDKAVLFTLVFRNMKVCFLDEMYYHYCVREGSTTELENPDYLIELTAFYKYAKQIFDGHKEREHLLRQLGKYLLQEARYAIDTKLALTTAGKPICKEPHVYRLDPSAFLPPKKKIILYGAGKVGSDYQKQMADCVNIELCGWVDKNHEKYQGKEVPVYPIDHIKETAYDYILVAVGKQTVYKEIKEELADMGIAKDAIIWGRPYGAPCGMEET